MKTRIQTLFTIILVAVCSWGGVEGQFEDLQGCVTNCRFVPLITSCLAEKFLNMLNLPPLPAECVSPSSMSSDPANQIVPAVKPPTTHTGVKLATPTLRSGYLDDVAFRHAQRKQQSKLSDQLFKFIENFLSKTQSLETDTPLLDKYLRSRSVPSLESMLLETMEPLREEANRLKKMLLEAQTAMMYMNREEYERSETKAQQRNLWSTLRELQRIVRCLQDYNETEYEDGLTWTKCLFICSDLPLLSTCMADAFTQIPECSRTMWLKDLIIRVFTDFLDLEDCFFGIQSLNLDDEQSISLEEGGAPSTVKFIVYQPPGVHCWPTNPLTDLDGVGRGVISNVFKLNPPCSVEIQLTTSNYMYDTLPYVRSDILPRMGRPKCRNGSAINQVAIGWHAAAVDSSGTISLNEQNWNQNFSVPLFAVIDYKKEHDASLNVSFTLKFVVDENIKHTTKLPMEVHDRDPVEISTCFSFNDPHIVTFDGLYYNNFYHGYFQMYKNEMLPYEVQVAYQACDNKINESCTCAVAVRSGDDVFVVDKCRHMMTSCETADCMNIQKIALYLNDELTPGTDIYKLDGGLSYMVSLPHGTLVKIVTNREMLNVYITPSPYDRNSTTGLCGTFNEIREDDLRLSDGTYLNITEELDPFIQSWRLSHNETIFEGTVESDVQYNLGNFCQCSHYLIGNSRCTCSPSELRQDCDLNLEGKFDAANITSIVRRSKKASGQESGDTLDMDFNYIPNHSPSCEDNVNWNCVDSFQYCKTQTQLSGKELIQDCKVSDRGSDEFLAPVNNALKGCEDDMAINDATNEAWRLSTLETMKYGCLERVYRSSGLAAASYSKYVNETCINDCSRRGFCVNGQCQCNEGYAGSDCSLLTTQPPLVIINPTNLCDTRYENCTYSTVFGRNFTDDGRLTCRATPRKAVDRDYIPNTNPVDVGIILLSTDQVACVLPRSGSFSIEILWNGNRLPQGFLSGNSPSAVATGSGPFQFKAYDSACYICDPGQDLCKEKQDGTYCLINNGCYANLQYNPQNDCQICNLTYSRDYFYYKTDERCTERRLQEEKARADDKRDQDIRIGVSVGLSGLVVIATLIMLAFSRRSDRKSLSSGSSSKSSKKSNSSHTSDTHSTKSISQVKLTKIEAVGTGYETETGTTGDSSNQSLENHGDLKVNHQNDSTDSENSSTEKAHHSESASDSTSPMAVAVSANGVDNAPASTIAVVLHPPPKYSSENTAEEYRVLQNLEQNANGLYPQVLLIGDENPKNGSIKSLSRVAMIRERTTSMSSAKSVGIGGGPPFQYAVGTVNRHSSSASTAAVAVNANVPL